MVKKRNPWLKREYNRGYRDGMKHCNNVVKPRTFEIFEVSDNETVTIKNDTDNVLKLNIIEGV